jgi:hypothetical protein
MYQLRFGLNLQSFRRLLLAVSVEGLDVSNSMCWTIKTPRLIAASFQREISCNLASAEKYHPTHF